MGQALRHPPLYSYWLEEQLVEATHLPLVIENPVAQMMQKDELKQLMQLTSQARHLRLLVSG